MFCEAFVYLLAIFKTINSIHKQIRLLGLVCNNFEKVATGADTRNEAVCAFAGGIDITHFEGDVYIGDAGWKISLELCELFKVGDDHGNSIF